MSLIRNVRKIFRLQNAVSQIPLSNQQNSCHTNFQQTFFRAFSVNSQNNQEEHEKFFSKFMDTVKEELQKFKYLQEQKVILNKLIKESKTNLKQSQNLIKEVDKCFAESTEIVRYNIKHFKEFFDTAVVHCQKVKDGRMLMPSTLKKIQEAKEVANFFKSISKDIDDLELYHYTSIIEAIQNEIAELEEGHKASEDGYKNEFLVGYHNSNFLSPKHYDVILPDFYEDICEDINANFEIDHLSPGEFSLSKNPIKGYICGYNDWLMIPLNCQYVPHHMLDESYKNNDAPVLKVLFLINTVFKSSFLNETTIAALKGGNHYCSIRIEDPTRVTTCHPSHSHFKEANILGMSYLREHNFSIENMNWEERTFQLVKK